MSLSAAASAADPPILVTGHAWAPFISPMGEPFRARTAADDTMSLWFVQADRNRDGGLTVDEMEADAARFFARLDEDSNGAVEPEEMIRYEWDIAPDVQVNTRTRRPPDAPDAADVKKPRRSAEGRLQGAARYALLNLPQPVAAADRDFDRSVTAAEFRQAAVERFRLLGGAGNGRLTFAGLDIIRSKMIAEGKRKRRKTDEEDEPDTRLATPL